MKKQLIESELFSQWKTADKSESWYLWKVYWKIGIPEGYIFESQDLKTVGRVVAKIGWGRHHDNNLYCQQEKVQNFFLHQIIDQRNPGTARLPAEIIEPPPVAFVTTRSIPWLLSTTNGNFAGWLGNPPTSHINFIIPSKEPPRNHQKKNSNFTIQNISKTPALSEIETISRLLIQESYRNINLPREITDVIANLWGTTTRSRNESVLRRFLYGISWNTDPCIPDVMTVLPFMQYMYINGCLCSGLCAAHNALSNIVTIKGCTRLSEHPFISCYLKIIYNRHQPFPKYLGHITCSRLLQ